MHDDRRISVMVHSEVFGSFGTDLETNTTAVDAQPSVVACISVWWWAKRQMSYCSIKVAEHIGESPLDASSS